MLSGIYASFQEAIQAKTVEVFVVEFPSREPWTPLTLLQHGFSRFWRRDARSFDVGGVYFTFGEGCRQGTIESKSSSLVRVDPPMERGVRDLEARQLDGCEASPQHTVHTLHYVQQMQSLLHAIHVFEDKREANFCWNLSEFYKSLSSYDVSLNSSWQLQLNWIWIIHITCELSGSSLDDFCQESR